LKVVPLSLQQLYLPEHKHKSKSTPRVVDPKRHHDGAPGPPVHCQQATFNKLSEQGNGRSRMLWSAPRRSFRFRGSVWSFERLNDSGSARADPSVISSPRCEHGRQQAASKNTSPRTARVRPEITFPGSDQQQISYLGLPTRIFEKSETLWQYFSEICKGGARSSSHWPCRFNLKSTIFQKYPTTQVFGRFWAQLSSSNWLNALQIP
jgi:hypothetical protein